MTCQVKLIAEPWDIGEGGYQVGNFPPLWTEWNGRYRDTVRDFWRGAGATLPEFASRLAGSADLYQSDRRRPLASTAQQISDLAARHREFADKLAQRQTLMIPAQDPNYEHLSHAFPAWPVPDRNAILQPPKPPIPPAERILELTADHDRDMEAAD